MFCSDNGGSPGTLPDNLHGFNATADSGEIGTLTRWAYVGPSWANVSNTPFKYFKTWTHHGGTCTPLIAFWPAGIEGKNRMSEFPGHFIDFMPTLIDVAGAIYPDSIDGERVLPMEGISFAPVFKNQAVDDNRAIFWQFSGGRGVRKNGWKLVSGERASASSWSVSRDTCEWALYHVRNDKTETNNLIVQKPKKADSLKLLYHQWFNRMEGFMEE
jgi:arylsulfatase